jgi:hypothetical protein
MTYIGIVIDKDVFKVNAERLVVDVGYGAALPMHCFVNEAITDYAATWTEYMCRRLSWPGQKIAENLICKIC